MILVVVLVHAVPPHRVQIGNGVDVTTDRIEVVPVLRVVDRIGLGHSDHGSVFHVRRSGEAQLLQLARGLTDQLGVRALPEPVTFETEVLHAETCPPRHRHHGGAPVVEILDTAHLHARSVDVDPVVREEIRLVEDQCDHEEVAIGQSLRGLPDRGRHRGLEGPHQRAHRHGGDHVIGLDSLVARLRLDADRHHLAVLHFDGGHPVLHPHLVAHLADPVAAHLPHLPGAQTGILELIDQTLDLGRALVGRDGGDDDLD